MNSTGSFIHSPVLIYLFIHGFKSNSINLREREFEASQFGHSRGLSLISYCYSSGCYSTGMVAILPPIQLQLQLQLQPTNYHLLRTNFYRSLFALSSFARLKRSLKKKTTSFRLGSSAYKVRRALLSFA